MLCVACRVSIHTLKRNATDLEEIGMSDLNNRFSNEVSLENYQSQVASLELFLNILGDNVAELKQVKNPQKALKEI